MINLSMTPQEQALELHCSQGDNILRAFRFALFNGNTEIPVPADASVLFQQSNGVTQACAVENGHVVMDVVPAMTAEPGIYRCNLRISKDGGVIHSSIFTLRVERRP